MDQTRKTLKAELGEDHWVLDYIRFPQDEPIEIKAGLISLKSY
jgi:hypothetical protein